MHTGHAGYYRERMEMFNKVYCVEDVHDFPGVKTTRNKHEYYLRTSVLMQHKSILRHAKCISAYPANSREYRTNDARVRRAFKLLCSNLYNAQKYRNQDGSINVCGKRDNEGRVIKGKNDDLFVAWIICGFYATGIEYDEVAVYKYIKRLHPDVYKHRS